MKTIAILLKEAYERLLAAGVPDPLLDAQYLLGDILKAGRLELVINGGSQVSQETQALFETALQRRVKREPLQHILGYQPFVNLNIKTDSRALIPRPETELLVERALEALSAFNTPKVLDLCTGTGAIGLAIKKNAPQAQVTLSDLSTEALTLARENAALLGLDVSFAQGDLFTPIKGQTFHLIVSNPPYIPLAVCQGLNAEVQQEPLVALNGGADGLDFYRRIAAKAHTHLKPGGVLLMEIGYDQGETVPELFTHDYGDIQVFKDYSQLNRMVQAKTK